jgi:hypothetical protein
MSEVTKEMVDAIRESVANRTVWDESDTQKVWQLLSYIDSLTADAGLETVGWVRYKKIVELRMEGNPRHREVRIFESSYVTEFVKMMERDGFECIVTAPDGLCLKTPATAAINALKAERDADMERFGAIRTSINEQGCSCSEPGDCCVYCTITNILDEHSTALKQKGSGA